MVKNLPLIILGVAVAGIAAYYLLIKPLTTGERAWPPYQNQLETYNPSGYAEDLYDTHIAFGQAPGSLNLYPGLVEGQTPWTGETRSY